MKSFETYAIKALLEGKVDIIAGLKEEYFTDKYKRLYILCLEFFEQHRKLPTYEELSAVIEAKAPIQVKSIYQALVTGLKNIEDLPEPQVIISGIVEQHVLRNVDADIEDLVLASRDRDVNKVKQLLNKLNNQVNLSGVEILDIADVKDMEDNHATVRSALPKEDEDEFLGGGHTGLTIVSAASGAGKACQDDTLIPTPHGRVRIADLAVGDTVYGRNGLTTKVTGVHPQGMRPTYKVTFRDGRSILVDEEHIWTVKSKGRKNEIDITTKEMLNTGLHTVRYDSRYNTTNNEKSYYVPLCSPVQYPTKELIIPPYVLGVIIGDGGTTQGLVNITSADKEVICNLVKEVGSSAVITDRQDTYSYDITRCREYTNYLKEKGLMCYSYDKHIPREYLEADVEQRIALLQGLIDTDGYVSKKASTVYYYTTSSELSGNIATLVRSLGGTAKITKKRRTGYKNTDGVFIECRPVYNVAIRFHRDSNIVPCRIARKVSLFRHTNKKAYNAIMSIDYVGEMSCTCISVAAEDKLYLAGDYIVTHNTVYLLQAAKNNYLDGKNVLFITLELPKSVLYKRLISSVSGIEFGKIMNQDLTDGEKRALNEAHDLMFNHSSENYFKIIDESIDDLQLLNIIAVEAQLRNLDVVVLDYIQLVEINSSGDDWRGLSNLAKKLHKLTRTYGISIITAAQVNVEGNEKGSIMPKITTRGSKELEFSSSQFIHLQAEPESGGLIMFSKKNRISECKHLILEKDFAHMKIESTGLALN